MFPNGNAFTQVISALIKLNIDKQNSTKGFNVLALCFCSRFGEIPLFQHLKKMFDKTLYSVNGHSVRYGQVQTVSTVYVNVQSINQHYSYHTEVQQSFLFKLIPLYGLPPEVHAQSVIAI